MADSRGPAGGGDGNGPAGGGGGSGEDAPVDGGSGEDAPTGPDGDLEPAVSPRWLRLLGVLSVVGGLGYLVASLLGGLVPRPDSYVFSPPLTHPQFLRGVVQPTLEAGASLCVLGGLAGLYLRDRGRYGRPQSAAAVAALATTVLAATGFFALAAVDLQEQAGGQPNDLAQLGAVLFWLATVGLSGLSLLAYGATLLWRDRRSVPGLLLLAAPVASVLGGVVLTVVNPAGALGGTALVTGPYALLWIGLGVQLWRRPSRSGETGGEGRAPATGD